MRFYMLIGLPFSGKSTYAETLPGFLHSIEKSKIKHPELSEAELRELIVKNTKTALQAKADVILDDYNLSRKKRQQLLEVAKKAGARTIAVLVLTPVDICKERAINRGVNPDKIDTLAKSFNIPTHSEFDEIRVIQLDIADDDIELDFSQDNGFHAFSLIKHLQLTESYLESDDPALKIAAANHDIGKAFTKTFYNTKGEKTEDAHYYGHDNYGAYWYLTTRKTGEFELDVARYINYHMRPMVWEKSEKAKNKDLEIWGEDFVKNLEILHKADMKAKK